MFFSFFPTDDFKNVLGKIPHEQKYIVGVLLSRNRKNTATESAEDDDTSDDEEMGGLASMDDNSSYTVKL